MVAPTNHIPNAERPSYGAAGQLAQRSGIALVALSLFAGFATFLILTGYTPIRPTHGVVITLLLIDLALCIAMIAVITWQVRGIVQSRREREAGSRLHVRVLVFFGLIALLPALTLAVFAVLSLDRGLDRLFSSKTKQIIENALNVAESYVEEHGQVIRAEVVAMARDIDDELKRVGLTAPSVPITLTNQAQLRQLPMAYLIDAAGKQKITASDGTDRIYRRPPSSALVDAKRGQAVLISPGSVNLVGAIKKLENLPDTYLYVARPVNASVIRQLAQARRGAEEYSQLESRRLGTQFAFALMYLVLALTFLLSAVWAGLAFADRLVTPIRRLMGAAQEVSGGNLDVTLPEAHAEKDLKQLTRQFNLMTRQLSEQRSDLVETNDALSERRQFIEAVLSGVTAGVIGLDDEGRVDLANPSALKLLATNEDAVIGQPLEKVLEEFADLREALTSKERQSDLTEQIDMRIDGVDRHFAVKLTKERRAPGETENATGMVITFDDITELVSAQRTSAWADVARRIAHEIKNPLTPIQLSAERLRRKYGKVITEDKDVFDRCTETIIRQVGDIGRMVDEFSSFARMPKPELAQHDIRNLIREAAFLFETTDKRIALKTDIPDTSVMVECDARLIGQAVTNLVKNATEAIMPRLEEDPDFRGEVVTRVSIEDGFAVLQIMDNGIGLPANRQRLLEPYMTTREKGTGLGLAIVNKIIEQHHGRLYLEDAPITDTRDQGACMRIVLPLDQSHTATTDDTNHHDGEGAEATAPTAASQAAE